MPEGINDKVANHRNPHSMRHVMKFTGQSSELAAFVSPLAVQDVVHYKDDFLLPASAAAPSYWAINQTGSGTNFAVPSTQLANGVVEGVTGTSSGNAVTLFGPLIYSGQQNPYIEARFKIDVITTLMYEIGFVDTNWVTSNAAINSIDTPTFTNAADALVIGMDTAATLTTSAFVTIGSGTNMVATKTALTVGTFPNTAFTPKAATYVTYRVGLAGNIPYCYVTVGSTTGTDTVGAWHIATGDTAASQVSATALLRPMIVCRTRTTAAKTMDIDYVVVAQDRLNRVA